MIGIDLLDDRDETLAPRDIDTFAGRVIVHIIRVANTGDAGYHHTAISVENDKLCRLSGYHEEAMVSFIERHRVVGLAGLQRPVRDRIAPGFGSERTHLDSTVRGGRAARCPLEGCVKGWHLYDRESSQLFFGVSIRTVLHAALSVLNFYCGSRFR